MRAGTMVMTAAAEARPWWRRNLSLLLLLAVLATAGAAYALRPPDGEQFALLLQQAQQGLETENPALLEQVLSAGYSDSYGLNRGALLAFFGEHLWQPFSVRLTVRHQEVVAVARHRARAELTVDLARTRGMLPAFTEPYTVTLDLRRERDGWKIVSAVLLPAVAP